MGEPEHPAAEPGTPAAERSSPPAERLPAGVPCYQCAYELAGLAPEGVCPECGLAIAASWPRRVAGGEERRRVDHARGRVRLVLATALALLGGTASLVLWACGYLVNAAGQYSPATFEDGEGLMLLGFALACLALLAYVVLATVLALSRRLPGERARLAVRVGGPTMAVGLVAFIVGGAVGAFFVNGGGALALLAGNASCVLAMPGVCGDMLAHGRRSRPPRWLAAVLVAAFLVLPIATVVAADGSVAGAGIALAAAVAMAGAAAVVAWQAIRVARAVEFDARRPGQAAIV